jgi:hypothetical protein
MPGIIVMLFLYVGSYFSFVNTDDFGYWEINSTVFAVESSYRLLHDDRCRVLFAPIEWLDQRVRPHHWHEVDTALLVFP